MPPTPTFRQEDLLLRLKHFRHHVAAASQHAWRDMAAYLMIDEAMLIAE